MEETGYYDMEEHQSHHRALLGDLESLRWKIIQLGELKDENIHDCFNRMLRRMF